jgi:hypothetical protein
MRSAYLEAPPPLDRGGISIHLSDFSSTNWALRAVKGAEEGDESHVDLIQYCESPLLHRTQFFIALKSPRSTHAAGTRWHIW